MQLHDIRKMFIMASHRRFQNEIKIFLLKYLEAIDHVDANLYNDIMEFISEPSNAMKGGSNCSSKTKYLFLKKLAN